MNSPHDTEFPEHLLTRREAIRRAAMMLGLAVTPSLLTTVMQAQAVSAGAGAAPQFLAPGQFATVAAIAERILPKSDTPGAGDVGVPAFLDLMYGRFMTDEEKAVFVAGLAEVDAASTAMRKRSFPELSVPQQDALLTKIAAASQQKEKTFFHLMKELTLLGYYSSEQIGRHVLHYDPIPGRYDGCIPLADVGNRAWTR